MASISSDVFDVTSVIEVALAHISPVEGVMVALTFFAWVGTVAYARQVRAVPRPQDMVARQIDEAAAARKWRCTGCDTWNDLDVCTVCEYDRAGRDTRATSSS